MNYSLVCKLLSRITLLIAVTMVFSLPWAHPALSHASRFEAKAFTGLLASILISAAVGAVLWRIGRRTDGRLYRKEAMAVVGLSWILATLLGALPFQLSGTYVSSDRPIHLWNVWDSWFESQSGFSTTGATVLTDLEGKAENGLHYVPRCILFWRSSTHFLGGLGIIVLFVAVLGQGSAGKALMRSEMPGPSKEGSQARMQHTAWVFAAIYCTLTVILAIILKVTGLAWFDSLCHAFGTMATGGFSTFNNSVGHFAQVIGTRNALVAEAAIVVFMVLAGTNFTLLYFFFVQRRLGRLIGDVEWRTYIFIIVGVTLLIMGFGYFHQDRYFYYPDDLSKSLASGLRQALFQVVAILTTTGFGSAADFDSWNSFGRGVLFLLMFIGGCAGSTGGSMKVIRHIMFLKILKLELEKAYHPSVVRPLRIAGEPVEDQELRKNILVYFGLILVIFVFSWMILVTIEPDKTWKRGGTGAGSVEHKLIDSASGIAATLNNIGPGLGTVGAKQNYSHFSPPSKILFTILMMIGRLEIFVILVLFLPGFWRNH